MDSKFEDIITHKLTCVQKKKKKIIRLILAK